MSLFMRSSAEPAATEKATAAKAAMGPVRDVPEVLAAKRPRPAAKAETRAVPNSRAPVVTAVPHRRRPAWVAEADRAAQRNPAVTAAKAAMRKQPAVPEEPGRRRTAPMGKYSMKKAETAV